MSNYSSIFHADIKLADMLNINPQLILMLPRFNIGLGFGEKRVEEVCQQNNVPVNLFLLLCNVYTFDSYIPSQEEINQIDGSILVKYLKESHTYYLDKRLSHIGKHIEKIALECGNIGNILNTFYLEYVEEVKNHFKFEEEKLFPTLLNKTSSIDFSEDFEESHSSIEDKLTDLTNIIIKYLPSDILPNERIGVWFDISQVSNDLKKHDIVEEKILIPFIQQLNSKKNGN